MIYPSSRSKILFCFL